MKNLFSTLALVLISASIMFASNGEPTTKSIDLTKSTVEWKAYKVGGSHMGTIQLSAGDLTMEEGALTGGSFTIDMASIACTDLEGEYAGKLVGHLASDDFFGVANFPTATLDITKVISRGVAGEYKVIAKLTIKDKTNPIKFNVSTAEDGTMNAEIVVDRSEYDVRYGSGSFIDNLGDNTIYDEFEISVSLRTAE